MEPSPRYEILNTIASGDFATVFRARDRELGREVAIKQIHPQFLADPRQLERYWREAQLLATLQHPNILTIYDIVRSRGWLILELMRGNLQQSVQTGPLDLDLLRLVLACCLNGLGFLHANGVIHGDVKPSNMLIDPQGRVKLGDFGLARRASNEQGSLLKGTTKYMAPELVSGQFGPVGPASDLYSLGFSAYELMCGPQFEALFPGLSTFGRDRQIAWLMWHAAPDRHLPEIARVLEGVPPDLARVIQRMATKDQSRRYASAQDALRDLRSGQYAAARSEEKKPDPEALQAAKQKKVRRVAAIAAAAVSLVLCLVMLVPPRKPASPDAQEVQPVQGIVRSIYADERLVALEMTGDGRREEVAFKPTDKFYINDKEAGFLDLQVSDQLTVEVYRDERGRQLRIVHATRPETQQGRIKALLPDSGKFTLAYETQKGTAEQVIRVPTTVKVLFNGQEKLNDQPVRLSELRPGDRVMVSHLGEEGGRVATDLSVEREVTLVGILREIDLKRAELKVEPAEPPGAKLLSLPLAEKCEVTLNDRRVMGQRALTLADLQPGDKATITHDRQVVRVDAYRIVGQGGVIRAVQPKMLDVTLQGQNKPTGFLVDDKTKITLGGEPAQAAELRAGDAVDVTHDSPDGVNPRALTVAARRPPDPKRWAALIGIQDYDDPALARLPFPAADATLLRDTLVKRYSVPANQALLLTDASLVRIRQELGGLLDRLQPEDSLVVYFAGHALRDADGAVYLAPKESNRGQIATTGMSLQGLVDRLESCRAQQKLLLLDACQAAPGLSNEQQPSTAEMFESLKAPPGQAALRTVTGIASCSKGQRGYALPARQHGLFAYALAEGFSGKADANRDNRLEVGELLAFVNESMASLEATIHAKQTAQLFLPDNRPPRLSAEAKQAIRNLAALLGQNEIDLNAARSQFDAAQAQAGKEIEPKLLFGLLLIKGRQRADALKHFEMLKAEQPGLLLPSMALAWLRFDRRLYPSGVDALLETAAKLPKPARPGEAYAPQFEAFFPWIGQLREAAVLVDEKQGTPALTLDKLDAAIAAHGDAAVKLYEQGRTQVREALKRIDERIAAAGDEAAKARLRIDRREISTYSQFPFAAAAQGILAGLDR